MTASGAQGGRAHHFQYMLLGLLVLIVIGPILRTIAPVWSASIFWVTIGVAMATGAATLASSTVGRVIGGLASAAIAVCALMAVQFGVTDLQIVAAIGFLAFCLWGIASSLRQVLTGPQVDLNRIAGAVCVYILMGYAWVIFYLLAALTTRDAFVGISASGVSEVLSQLTYFSFVTLTTLGYGDISPLAPIAQSLAYLEAIVGQLYLAILIAGLVGAHLSVHRK
jgi:voltage-gated potassium channel